MKKSIQLVKRGEIFISGIDVLKTIISTCVSICFYHSGSGLGGITHISRSRRDDATPSGRFVKFDGYYYADRAIPGIIEMMRMNVSGLREKSLQVVVVGGMNGEGPVAETLVELGKHDFKTIGKDINSNFQRYVTFTPSMRSVHVKRKVLYGAAEDDLDFKFS